MAIKLRRGENFFYTSVAGGLLDKKEQQRADEIYASAKNALAKEANRTAPDFLVDWYSKGVSVNKIIRKFDVTDDEKKFFWMMLYEVSGMTVPERIRTNDFRVASILASYPLEKLRQVGAWSLWREIVGSTKIGSDDRVAQWVVGCVLGQKMKTREQARPLLMAVRNRLKRIDTSVLSDAELAKKLQEVMAKK